MFGVIKYKRILAPNSGGGGSGGGTTIAGLTAEYIPQSNLAGDNLINGTWKYIGNDIAPVTGGSNLGGASNRIGSGFINTLNYATDLVFSEAGSEKGRFKTGGWFNIGVDSNAARLVVQGSGTTSATFTAKFQNSAGALSLQVRDDGSVYNQGKGSIAGNTAFGDSALIANVSGTATTAYGVRALAGNTIGENNTAFGYEALVGCIGGGYNTAIGTQALANCVSGDDNVAVGRSAGLNCNGISSTFVGRAAGLSTTGSYNSAFGHSALQSNSTGIENVAIGRSSLFTTNGDNNTSVGSSSLYNNTGSGNVALGFRAAFHETGSNKLFIDNAMRASEAAGRTDALIYGIFDAAVANQRLTINGNVGIQGTQIANTSLTVSGLGTTSGTFTAKFQNSSSLLSLQVRDDGSVYNLGGGSVATNTAFGLNSLINNVSGSQTVSIGVGASRENTTGINNTSVGYFANNVNNGSGNTSLGYGANSTSTNSTGNTAIGSLSLANGANAGYNTAVGADTLSACTSYYNVAIGNQALEISTSAEGNTAVGYVAGARNVTGDYNVFVGFAAGNYATGSNELYIDAIARGSNALEKTNGLIYGIFDAAVANQRLRFNANVAIGGGAATATSTLNISNLPTSAAGLATGDVWNNGGVLTIV